MRAGGTTIPAAGQEKEGSEYNAYFKDFRKRADVLTPEVTEHDLGCQVRATVGKQRELEIGMFRGNSVSRREHRAVKVKAAGR